MNDPLDQCQPRVRNSPYMGWIAKLPCVGHMARGEYVRPVEVAHLRCGSLEHGKRPTGMGERPSDRPWTLPLCSRCHRLDNDSQHSGGELEWWANIGINPFALCLALDAAYEASAAGSMVIARFVADGRRVIEGRDGCNRARPS